MEQARSTVSCVELLRSPRVILRHWRQDDLSAFFDIYSRWEVARWLGAPPRRPVVDREQARERLARWQRHEAELPLPYGLWALVRRDMDNDIPVGTVLLMPLHDRQGVTDEVEIGWHLHPDHQGVGLATEAAGALLDRARRAGRMRVLALTDPDNTASQAVARRLGMADEGLTTRWYDTTTRQFCWRDTCSA
jgi:RimJ/RimL family protein N-acetyltransferase